MSQQLSALSHRTTTGERRRRLAKIARRRARGIVDTTPAARVRTRQTWQGFKALRLLRQVAKDRVGNFVAALLARRETATAKTAARCPFRNVRRTLAGDIVGPDALKAEAMPPCGGRLRKLPMPKEATTQHWRCQSCGRAWDHAGGRNRGFYGWVEVAR